MINHMYYKLGIVRKGMSVILLCGGIVITGVTSVSAALLDGLFNGPEESLEEKLSQKGEKLVLGNFYSAERPDEHGPIGVMGNHTHNKGEFMFSYRYMNMFMKGNRTGTDDVSDQQVLAQFPITPTEMTTQMHMFSSMYGFNDTVTFMAMLPYVFKSMDHLTRTGVRFTTKSAGFGDLRLTTLWRLYAIEAPSIGAHRTVLNLGVSLPTGSIQAADRTPASPNADVRLPYPMQLGSGTVDLLPGFLYRGNTTDVSWGFRYLANLRIGTNAQGYTRGDTHEVTGWGAYRWANWISTSVRFNYRDWDNFDGADPNLNPAQVPTADPALRGGERLDVLGGVNILFPEWLDVENRLAVEVGVPIYQNLNGPQLESDYVIWAGYQFVM